MSVDDTVVLFVSHAYTDLDLASFLKDQIRASFPNAVVFVSSDPESLPPRDPWVETILDYLKRAALILVLATERSLKRSWVWFEAGAGWGEVPRFLTCCAGKTHKGLLPPPFSFYTALNIGEPTDLRTFFNELRTVLGEPAAQPDFDALALQIGRIEESVARKQAGREDPRYDGRWQLVQDKMQDLEQPLQDILKLLILNDSMTVYDVLQAFKTKGLKTDYRYLEALRLKTGWIEPVPGQLPTKRPVHDFNWQIKPTFRPLLERYFSEKGEHKAQ